MCSRVSISKPKPGPGAAASPFVLTTLETTDAVMHQKEQITNRTNDPVCGMTVDPERAAATREHAGKQYFFCCAHCAQKFEASPQQYLAPKPKSAGLVQLGSAPAKPVSAPHA